MVDGCRIDGHLFDMQSEVVDRFEVVDEDRHTTWKAINEENED